MPTKTKIEWCDYISNPLKALLGHAPNITGAMRRRMGHACVKISEGCAHCWASSMNVRLGTGLEYTAPNMANVETVLDVRELERLSKFQPRGPFKHGRDRALVFPCDMTDMFGSWVTVEMLEDIFGVFAARADVDFMVLTKRPDHMRAVLMGTPVLPNVILGVSVENQKVEYKRRLPLETLSKDGWKTAVSYEPALGLVDWRGWEFLDWLICGGESGTQARPMRVEWARAARDFCQENHIPFFFKQWGEWAPRDQLEWLTPETTFKWKPVDGMFRVGRGLAGNHLDGLKWCETAKSTYSQSNPLN